MFLRTVVTLTAFFAAFGPVASYSHFLEHALELVEERTIESSSQNGSSHDEVPSKGGSCELCNVVANGRTAVLAHASAPVDHIEAIDPISPRAFTALPPSPHRAPASPRAPPLG